MINIWAIWPALRIKWVSIANFVYVPMIVLKCYITTFNKTVTGFSWQKRKLKTIKYNVLVFLTRHKEKDFLRYCGCAHEFFVVFFKKENQYFEYIEYLLRHMARYFSHYHLNPSREVGTISYKEVGEAGTRAIWPGWGLWFLLLLRSQLCCQVSHLWENRRGQHTRSAMGEPRPGKTSFVIMVGISPAR